MLDNDEVCASPKLGAESGATTDELDMETFGTELRIGRAGPTSKGFVAGSRPIGTVEILLLAEEDASEATTAGERPSGDDAETGIGSASD